MSISIVTTGSTYNINELLVNGICHLINLSSIYLFGLRVFLTKLTGLILLCCIRIFVVIVQTTTDFFVSALKDQMIRVLFEPLRDLCPNRNIFFPSLVTNWCFFGIILLCAKHSPPSTIPVDVDDDIHFIVQCIIYDCLNTIKQFFIDRILSILRHKIRPSNRNTNSIYTIALQAIKCLLCCFRITGTCLTLLDCCHLA